MVRMLPKNRKERRLLHSVNKIRKIMGHKEVKTIPQENPLKHLLLNIKYYPQSTSNEKMIFLEINDPEKAEKVAKSLRTVTVKDCSEPKHYVVAPKAISNYFYETIS